MKTQRHGPKFRIPQLPRGSMPKPLPRHTEVEGYTLPHHGICRPHCSERHRKQNWLARLGLPYAGDGAAPLNCRTLYVGVQGQLTHGSGLQQPGFKVAASFWIMEIDLHDVLEAAQYGGPRKRIT